jgi:hypothetical protein
VSPCASAEPAYLNGNPCTRWAEESRVIDAYGVSIVFVDDPSEKVKPVVLMVIVLLDERFPLLSRIVVNFAKKGEVDI